MKRVVLGFILISTSIYANQPLEEESKKVCKSQRDLYDTPILDQNQTNLLLSFESKSCNDSSSNQLKVDSSLSTF
jgi:hypothetical protein